MVMTVVASVHDDLHDLKTLDMLMHIADGVINVMVPAAISSLADGMCKTLQKRQSGRVARSVEYFSLKARNIGLPPEVLFVHVDEVLKGGAQVPGGAGKQGPTFTSGDEVMPTLPFNVSITEEQRLVRDAVVERGQTKSTAFGEVDYEESDDADVEFDPDDDLDL